MIRAAAVKRAADAQADPDLPEPFDVAVLAHGERHIRRKALALGGGEKVLVDLPRATALEDGDRLVLEDGRQAGIVAAREELHAVTAHDRLHLARLAWHLGNRHLPAQIEETRILIPRDHVIKAMLEGLGARVADVWEPFRPVRGAYSKHGHAHGHEHAHHHSHGEDRHAHGGGQ